MIKVFIELSWNLELALTEFIEKGSEIDDVFFYKRIGIQEDNNWHKDGIYILIVKYHELMDKNT